jgi:major inositol transporter-like SP family MFS transporter
MSSTTRRGTAAGADGATQRRYLRRVTWVATLGGLLFGFDTGVINGALPFMVDDLRLTAFTEGLVASSLVFGAAFGALAGGRLADAYGRKKMIIVLAVVFLVGTLGTALAPDVTVMVVSRLVLGLAVGGASVMVPIFLAELSPAGRRGQVVTRNELMIVTGQLLAFSTSAFLGNVFGDSHGIWRWMLVLATLPAIGLWIGMHFVPESPRWLAGQGAFGTPRACCSASAPRPWRSRSTRKSGRWPSRTANARTWVSATCACRGSAGSWWWASASRSSSRSPA